MHAWSRVCTRYAYTPKKGWMKGEMKDRRKGSQAGRERGGRKRRCRAHQSACTHVSDVRASNTPSGRPLIELKFR